jgi:flagellar protein FliS
MTTPDGYAQYQENQLMTASPAKLLLAAYDGAIRFCKVALEKMVQKEYADQCVYLNKAIAIVCELASTLREDIDPTLVGRLKSLYAYVLDKLGDAMLHEDTVALNEAISVLGQLRDAWSQAEKNILVEKAGREAA